MFKKIKERSEELSSDISSFVVWRRRKGDKGNIEWEKPETFDCALVNLSQKGKVVQNITSKLI